MNGLPDPIAGKGYANILPALRVPEFGEIASMQTANNQLALNAAKLAADQKAKADALAAAKVKAEKEAQDAAKKAEAKKQADAWTLIAPENSPLIGDAPKWAAEAYDKMVKEAQGLMAQGIDLNSFDPKAVAFRSGTLQNYHVNYKRHSEVAKALAEKQKKWNENPDGFEPFSLADELGSKYNVTGWDKDYYTPSLLPKVGVATPAEIAAYEKQMFGESASRVSRSKKPIGYDADGDVIYSETESYEARPFEATAEDVNKNLRYSTDTKQKQLYNFYYNQAKAQGMVDENDNILPQFLQKREETTREKGGVKPVTVQIQKEKVSGSGDNTNFNFKNLGDGRYDIGNTKNIFVIKEGSIPLNTNLDTEGGESTFFGATNKMLKVPVIPSAGVTDLGYNFDPNEVDISNITQIDENGNQIAVKEQPEFSTAQRAIVRYLPKRQDGQYGASVLDESGKHDVQSGDVVDYEASYFVKDKTGNRYIIPAVKATPTMKTYIRIPKNEVDVMFGGQQVQQPQTPPTTQEIPAGMKPKGKPKKQF